MTQRGRKRRSNYGQLIHQCISLERDLRNAGVAVPYARYNQLAYTTLVAVRDELLQLHQSHVQPVQLPQRRALIAAGRRYIQQLAQDDFPLPDEYTRLAELPSAELRERVHWLAGLTGAVCPIAPLRPLTHLYEHLQQPQPAP